MIADSGPVDPLTKFLQVCHTKPLEWDELRGDSSFISWEAWRHLVLVFLVPQRLRLSITEAHRPPTAGFISLYRHLDASSARHNSLADARNCDLIEADSAAFILRIPPNFRPFSALLALYIDNPHQTWLRLDCRRSMCC